MAELLKLFEEEPKNPHAYTGPSRAMLIVGHDDANEGYLYCVSGIDIELDLDGFGIATAELLAFSEAPTDKPGVHVWEGKVRWHHSTSPEGTDEGSESDYSKGKWREPTSFELSALATGARPWPKIDGNPEYCEKKDSHKEGTECDKCWFGQPNLEE
jgi:hypothetical protein